MASTPSYLGPVHRFQLLNAWSEVEDAARRQLLDENQWVELKKDIPEGKVDSRETAKDLASLSVHGGTLIVGIEEVKDGRGKIAGKVVGAPTATLADRISSIAAALVKPALMVITHVIAHPSEPDLGLLVVTVPASPLSPHMVDGRYWGRSAIGRQPLEDVEVRRLIADHATTVAGFDQQLRAMVGQDPPGLAGLGRLYLLIEPTTTPWEDVIDLVGVQHLLEVVVAVPGMAPSSSPGMSTLGHSIDHGEGLAAASLDPIQRPGTDSYFFVLLGEDGSVRVSAPLVHPPTSGAGGDDPMIVMPYLLATVHNALLLAAHVAVRHTGYQGTWRIGLHATALLGVRAAGQDVFSELRPYRQHGHTRVEQASTEQMSEHTPDLVKKLTRRLLRGLGVEDRWPSYAREMLRRRPSA